MESCDVVVLSQWVHGCNFELMNYGLLNVHCVWIISLRFGSKNLAVLHDSNE